MTTTGRRNCYSIGIITNRSAVVLMHNGDFGVEQSRHACGNIKIGGLAKPLHMDGLRPTSSVIRGGSFEQHLAARHMMLHWLATQKASAAVDTGRQCPRPNKHVKQAAHKAQASACNVMYPSVLYGMHEACTIYSWQYFYDCVTSSHLSWRGCVDIKVD
nr:uncharacterized protein LOC119163996 isoform X1 [Rhipicephalus microplus]